MQLNSPNDLNNSGNQVFSKTKNYIEIMEKLKSMDKNIVKYLDKKLDDLDLRPASRVIRTKEFNRYHDIESKNLQDKQSSGRKENQLSDSEQLRWSQIVEDPIQSLRSKMIKTPILNNRKDHSNNPKIVTMSSIDHRTETRMYTMKTEPESTEEQVKRNLRYLSKTSQSRNDDCKNYIRTNINSKLDSIHIGKKSVKDEKFEQHKEKFRNETKDFLFNKIMLLPKTKDIISYKIKQSTTNHINTIEYQIQRLAKKYKHEIDEFQSKNWSKFCYQDENRKYCFMMNRNSLYLQLCKWFHPASASQISKNIGIKSSFSKDQQLNEICRKIFEWNIDKIYEFCYNVYNPNQIGAIDTNDLMIYQRSFYCLDRNSFQNDDILKMESSMKNSNHSKEDNTRAVIKKEINKHKINDLINSKNARYEALKQKEKYTEKKNRDAKIMIEQIQEANLNYQSTRHNHIDLDDFKKIEWNQLNDTNFYLPEVQTQLMQTLCGLDIKGNQRDNKQGEFQVKVIQTESMEDAMHDFHQNCEQMNLNPYECSFDIRKMESLPQYFQIVKQFQKLADEKLVITLESLTKFIEDTIGMHGALKIAERIYSCASIGQPVTLQKQAHFLLFYQNTGLKFLWELFNLNDDGSVGTQEIEFWKDAMHFYKQLINDFEKLEYALDSQQISSIDSKFMFEQQLDGYSMIQNFIWMLLQGDNDYLKQGTKKVDVKFLKAKKENILNFDVNTNSL